MPERFISLGKKGSIMAKPSVFPDNSPKAVVERKAAMAIN